MGVRVDLRDGFGQLTLDRPLAAHAYTRQMLDALADGFAQLAKEASVIWIGSTGDRAFCAGADLHELGAASPTDALDLRSQQVFDGIARSPVVSVCAIQGPAVAGGCELALACDLRVVGPGARLRLPETSMGLIPAAGGCTRLTQLVGQSVAKQVILAGHELSAEDCGRLGLAIGPVADVHAEAEALCRRLVGRDPIALRLAKQVIDGDGGTTSLGAERVAEALLYSRRPQ